MIDKDTLYEKNEDVPVQYRKGKASFFDIEVAVDPRVLIPRPETELLVSVTADTCSKKGWKEPLLLEIGTGSGVIPICIARKVESCRIMSFDLSEDALHLAGENIEKYGLSGRIELGVSDMFNALGENFEGSFDVIVSNPPYVSAKDFEKLDVWVQAEPRMALFSGKDGMDHLNIIADKGLRFLKPGGMCAVEIGYDQAEKVKEAFKKGGFSGISSYRDPAGHERVITGWKNG